MKKRLFLPKSGILLLLSGFMILTGIQMTIPEEPAYTGKEKPVTVFQDFSEAPGWEGYHNRVKCSDGPMITQDFGWGPTNHTGSGPGEIGGTIWKSTTPAYYAMPIGPYSFKDTLTASGKIAVTAPPKEGAGFYIGFFNHYRQGWRVWSSIGFRIGEVRMGKARFHLDYKTGRGKGAILNPDVAIPCDGSVHTWKLVYEPYATVKDVWPDPRLPGWIGDKSNTHEDTILVRGQKDDPSITKESLEKLLKIARDLGLVDDWYRKGRYHLWEIDRDAAKMKGRITLAFDDQKPVSFFLLPGHMEEPSQVDRFGIWNMQIYTGNLTFYLSDLVVNDEKIDLSKDPYWDSLNNRVSFVQDDFHARQNFGFSQTNWAGEAPGEIGGRFWGTEVADPLHAYYADDIGRLTLDDPISFSGWINFTEGAVDGRMLLGYFNKKTRLADIEGEYKGNPPHQFLGLEVMDQTRYGYNFTAVCSPRQDKSFEVRGPIYIPDRIKRPFSFKYDPDEGEAGRITVTLGEKCFSADLTEEQRRIGASFDRFGILNPRKGGKYVDVYVDDLSYDVKHPKRYKPKFQKQEITVVPYPPGGRLYK